MVEENFKITEKSERELKWYFMSQSPVPVHPNTVIVPILSFDLDKAVEKINAIKPLNVFIASSGSILVSDLLKEIAGMGYDLSGVKITEPTVSKEIIIHTPPAKPTSAEFVERLTLVAEEYCEPRDKNSILKILEKVKLKVVEKI